MDSVHQRTKSGVPLPESVGVAVGVGPQSDQGCFASISSGSMQQPSPTVGLGGGSMSGGSGMPVARRGRPSRAAIHNRLAEEVNELRQRLGGLPLPVEAEDIWTEIWYQEAHGSTAIEGNTLVLREVATLLRDGRAVGDKQLKDYLEVTGYADAAQWVYGQALAPGGWTDSALLTLAEVRQIHARAMDPVWGTAPHPDASDQESPGNWRRHNIQVFPGGMQPPDFTQVSALITDWVTSVNKILDDDRPPAEAIAVRHAQFERIHPFLDGNGRTGRLLMNLILVRLGYPPAIIYKRDRSRYLAALTRSDQGDHGPLGEMIARAILDNLMRFVLPAVAGPARLVPLEALAGPDISVVALRNAALRGRLRAVRTSNGSWRSSKQWVDAYRANRYSGLRVHRSRTDDGEYTEPAFPGSA
jgi:Fic family protein